MSKITLPGLSNPIFEPPTKGANLKALLKSGRLPTLTLQIQPLGENQDRFFSAKFLSYNFSSNIMVPVDTFSFTMTADENDVFEFPVKEGDIAVVQANAQPLATGIVDTIETETDYQQGTRVSLHGRDLLSQFEDQDAVSLDSVPVYSNKYTVSQVVAKLAEDSRISPTPTLKSAPSSPYLFATQPGESKLSAFQRYCEGLNILFWMSPTGKLIVGKPTFEQAKSGDLFVSRKRRDSNVLSIRSTRNSTSIPNIVCPIWNGQETVQNRVSKEQVLFNANEGPKRLRTHGHRVPKAVIISTPQGASPQDLSEINTLALAGQSQVTAAGAANLLQAYAKREAARQNIKELQVQMQVFGHFNENGQPYMPDQVYHVEYDLDGIDEDMYLYGVEYTFSEDQSQRTNLFFCRKNCLVADYALFTSQG